MEGGAGVSGVVEYDDFHTLSVKIFLFEDEFGEGGFGAVPDSLAEFFLVFTFGFEARKLIVHGDDDRRLEFADELVEMLYGERVAVADRNKEDVYVTEFLDGGGGELVSQSAQMTEGDILTMEEEYGVLASKRSSFFIMKRRKAEHGHAAYVVLARTIKERGFFGNVTIFFTRMCLENEVNLPLWRSEPGVFFARINYNHYIIGRSACGLGGDFETVVTVVLNIHRKNRRKLSGNISPVLHHAIIGCGLCRAWRKRFLGRFPGISSMEVDEMQNVF